MNPSNPKHWFIKADRGLGLANLASLHTPGYPDLICYHCQQAAEKFLRALVVHHKLPLRKTHDLEQLLDILSSSEPSIDPYFL